MAVDNRTANRNYPLPDPTNNLDEDVYRLVDAFNGVDGDMKTIFDTLPTKSNVGHGHQIADISGLQSALDGKAAAGHTHALNDLSDVNVSGAANGQFLKRVSEGWLPAGLTIEDVASLQTALNARAMLDGSSVVVPAGTSSQRPAAPDGPRFRFNTTLGEFEGWNGTEWGLIGGSGEAMRDTFLYVAVGGETTIPVAGGYTPGQVIVVLNGVVLEPDTDVNVSSGTNIVFPSPLVTGDRVNFYRFRAFDVATAVAYIAQSLSPSEQAQARQNIGLGDILASLRYMGSIGSAEDLDTYTTPGVYVQNQSAGASGGTNYPVANAGMLEVLDGGGATNVRTVQRYTEYSQPPETYQRMRRNGGNWSAWLNLSEWSATTVSQAEAEAGTSTTRRAWTAQRVAQAIAALTPAPPPPEVGLYTGSVRNETVFPVGHHILVGGSGNNGERNSTKAVYLPSSPDSDINRYVGSGGSTALAGTWRARGNTGTANEASLYQRVA